jgi:hypothetical protein
MTKITYQHRSLLFLVAMLLILVQSVLTFLVTRGPTTLIRLPPLSHFAIWEEVNERLALHALGVVFPGITSDQWEVVEQFLSLGQLERLIAGGNCLESTHTTPLRSLMLNHALCELSRFSKVEPSWESVVHHLSQVMFDQGYRIPYDQVTLLHSFLNTYWFVFITSLWDSDEPDMTIEPEESEGQWI